MIKINKMTDYSVLVLTRLDKSLYISSDVISEMCGLNKSTVSQVLKNLSNGKLVKSKKGVSGGVRLNKEIKDISLLDVIKLMEGGVCLTECSSTDTCNCNCLNKCGLQNNWDAVNLKLEQFFRDIKVLDLMGDK